MAKQKSIIVQNVPVQIISDDETDYISITDMANAKENESRAADIIKNWIRNRYTLEFLGTWEQLNNPGFKVVEFDHFIRRHNLCQQFENHEIQTPTCKT
jgi:hypothetical protein